MNKITAGILVGAGAVGIATAAYIPVKVGDTVHQQIELAVASANAKQGSSGIEIEILDYKKNAYSSSLVTRFIFKDPDMAQMNGKAPFFDIAHKIDHGFSDASFKSEIRVSDEMQESLRDFDGKVPLHFDGVISLGKSTLNTYIEGFTVERDNGTIKMNPGIIRLNYDADKESYQLEGHWNGINMDAEGNLLNVGQTSITGNGQKETPFIWSYNNNINIGRAELSNEHILIRSNTLSLKDSLSIESLNNQEEGIHYSGHWSLENMHIEQYSQTLYDFEPSQLSYTLTGPSVKQADALMEIAQNMDAEEITTKDAENILPVFADVVNAAQFSLHDINVATSEGRIKGDIALSLETNQEELIKALSFPPLLARYVKMETNAAINKSLFNSMPVFAMMAMQLNQVGAYRDDDEDMLIHAQMQNGQVTINDVPMR